METQEIIFPKVINSTGHALGHGTILPSQQLSRPLTSLRLHPSELPTYQNYQIYILYSICVYAYDYCNSFANEIQALCLLTSLFYMKLLYACLSVLKLQSLSLPYQMAFVCLCQIYALCYSIDWTHQTSVPKMLQDKSPCYFLTQTCN